MSEEQGEIKAALLHVLESMERCNEMGRQIKRQKIAIDRLATDLSQAVAELQEARAVDQTVMSIMGGLFNDSHKVAALLETAKRAREE